MRKGLLIIALTLILALVCGGLVFGAGQRDRVPDEELSTEELAQRYANAEPGEEFMIGHITFHLG